MAKCKIKCKIKCIYLGELGVGMTKKALKKAPLVQAIIHLRFSAIPNLSPIPDESMKRLHEKMIEVGFEEKIPSSVNIVKVEFDAATKESKQTHALQQRIVFRASGEREVVELGEQQLILKITNYDSFDKFYERFQSALNACVSAIDGLSTSLLKEVGLRYIDVLVPPEGEDLSTFVETTFLPPRLQFSETTAEQLGGMTAKALKPTENQVLTVNLEERCTVGGRVDKVLPDILMEPDNKTALIIQGHREWLNVTSDSYAILDIDHTFQFTASPKFNSDEIKLAVQKLYRYSSDVFWQVVTDKAQKHMGVYDV